MLRLSDLREDKDLSQAKIASTLNISRSQYSGLELETNRITHDKLYSRFFISTSIFILADVYLFKILYIYIYIYIYIVPIT